MIQWIITSTLVLLAIIYAGYRTYKYFQKRPAISGECCERSGDCNNCQVKVNK